MLRLRLQPSLPLLVFMCVIIIMEQELTHQTDLNTAEMLENMAKMEKEIANLSMRSDSALKKLDKLSKASSLLGTIASPIAKWLYVAIKDQVIQSDSPELGAIRKLDVTISREFNELGNRIEELIKHVECEQLMDHYDDVVNTPMKGLMTALQRICNLKYVEHVEEMAILFADECKKKDPKDILAFVNGKVKDNCKMQTATSAFTSSSGSVGGGNLCKWSGRIASVVQYSGNPFDDTFLCYPDEVLQGHAWQRKPMLAFAEIVHVHMLQLLLIANFCYNAPPYTEAQKDVLMDEMEETVKSASGHLAMWMERKLESCWPSVIEDYALKSVGMRDIWERNILPEVAQNMERAAFTRGPLDDQYQVLVWLIPAYPKSEWFHAVCSRANDCLQQNNFRNLNIVLTRFHTDEVFRSRARNAQQWFSEQRATIKKIIADNQWSWDVGYVFTRIERAVGGAMRSHFRSAILLRDEKWVNIPLYLEPCNASIGWETHYVYGYAAHASIFHYKEESSVWTMTKRCTEWRLVLFL